MFKIKPMKTARALKEMTAATLPRRTRLGVVLAIALLSTASAMTGCKDAKRNDGSATDDAGIVQTSAAPVASSIDSAAIPTTARPSEETRDEPLEDAGPDAGKMMKRRRVVGSVADAGPVTVEAPSPPPVSAVVVTTERRPGKAAMPLMGDDLPYGGAGAASSTPILKKKPLGDDDPWAKGAPSSTPR